MNNWEIIFQEVRTSLRKEYVYHIKRIEECSCDQSIAGRMPDNEIELVASDQITQVLGGHSKELTFHFIYSERQVQELEAKHNLNYALMVPSASLLTVECGATKRARRLSRSCYPKQIKEDAVIDQEAVNFLRTGHIMIFFLILEVWPVRQKIDQMLDRKEVEELKVVIQFCLSF